MRIRGSGAHWAAAAGIALILVGATACAVAALRPRPSPSIVFDAVPPQQWDASWTNTATIIYRDGRVDAAGNWGHPVVLREEPITAAIVTVSTNAGAVECAIRVNGRQVAHKRTEAGNVATCSWSPLR